jgi:uncharacterized membrane protein
LRNIRGIRNSLEHHLVLVDSSLLMIWHRRFSQFAGLRRKGSYDRAFSAVCEIRAAPVTLNYRQLMKSSILVFSLSALGTATSAASPAWALAPPQYFLEVAGFFAGTDYGQVTGMNNSGQTVFVQQQLGIHSYWWTGSQSIELSPGDPSSYAVVHDLNDSGVAVGSRILNNTTPSAMIWNQGVPQPLGTMGGRQSQAAAINRLGTVAGWSDVPGNVKHLFTWYGAFTDLGPMPPSGSCCHDIEAINDSGQIVGHDSGSLLKGWLYDSSHFTSLPDLAGGFDSTPRDINNSGLVVGASNPNQSDLRPVTWFNAQVSPLQMPPGAGGGEARVVNDVNQIAGTVGMPHPILGSSPQAIVWQSGIPFLLRDVVTNLGDWQLWHSEQIDDHGKILVFAYSNTMGYRRVYLTPIPEPVSATGFLFGLAGLPAVSGRYRRPYKCATA